MARKYDASSISVLEELEGVRANPGMYVGDVDYVGSLQAFKEIVQNATDELREVGGGRVRVRVGSAQGVQFVMVADEGRGIPVEKHPKTGLSTLETVFTKLHAGGKSGDKTAYGKRTIGVHGVGASVVNALALRLDVWTKRSGTWWYMAFAKGKRTQALKKADPPFRWKCGTIVRYQLDKEVMPDDLRLKDAQAYCALARYWDPVEVDYQDPERSAVLEARRPEDLLKVALARRQSTILAGPVVISSNGVRAVVAWTDGSKSDVVASVAGAPVPSGTHVQGLEEAARAAIQSLREGRRVDGTLGLLAVLDVSVDRPQFSGQAKANLRTREVRKRVAEAAVQPLTKFLRRNRQEANKVLDHASNIGSILAQADEKKELAKATKDSKNSRQALPRGFVSALRYPAEKREMFVLEGISAKGTAVQGKMPWQEILALKGKLPNVVRKSSLLSNDVVLNIISAMGYDANNPGRPLRIGKLIILTDADPDGGHITVLLLAVLYRIMPEILERGIVYVVDAPLFEALDSRNQQVTGNDLGSMTREHGKLKNVNRMKGWGGCEAPLLRRVAFDPATRTWIRVGGPSKKEKRQFQELMGADSTARRQLLERA